MRYLNYNSSLNARLPKPLQVVRDTIAVADDVYRELAELIRVQADYSSSDDVVITAEASRNGYTYIVTTSVILRFIYDQSPCGRPLVYLRSITPMWVEMHTFDEWGEECPNDFYVSKLTKLL